MSRTPRHPARRAVALVIAATLGGAVMTVVASSASADPTALSALFLRNDATTIYREPDATTTLSFTQGTESWQGTDYPEFRITSQIGNDFSTMQSVSVSAGLAPGTYTTSRIPGEAQAILDPGSLLSCGGDEPGTLDVQQADYDGGGDAIDFAASFDVAGCDSEPPVHGEIRWNSTTPLQLAQASVPSTPKVTVNSSADVSVQFTAAGDGPTTMGQATLTQTAMSDGTDDWSVVDDGCDGTTLAPGDACTVTARIAPVRPDGSPHGIVAARITVPDGQPIDASAPIAADVYPLSGQVLGLQASGAFRHVVLTWQQPGAVASGWSLSRQMYDVYSYLPDGSLHLLTQTPYHFAVISGLPDDSTGKYVVRDDQSGTDAPLSVPAVATTATRELIYIDATGGLLARRLAPQATAVDGAVSQHSPYGSGTTGLTVSRNQSVLAYTQPGDGTTPGASYVCSAYVDGAPGAGFCSGTDKTTQHDSAPALSPDGRRIVFTRALPGGTTAIESASTTVVQQPTPVPNSSGLFDATFDAAGTGLIAVQDLGGGSTKLVRLSFTGARSDVAGGSGLTEPDVAKDGRIVAVQPSTDPDATYTEGLVLLGPSATPSAIAGAQDGLNAFPHFAADGASVFYTHTDGTTGGGIGDGEQVDLAGGAVTELVDTGTVGTPYILTADGTHGLDTAAPTTQMNPTSTVDLATTATVYWSATDSTVNQVSSGIRSYDVRYRAAPSGHPFGGFVYPAALQATTRYAGTVPVTAGSEYCFSARSRDFAGNVSGWTAERCTTSPLDDRALSTSAARRTSSSYYLRTYSGATKKGTRYVRGGVSGRRIGIVATTCASCGQVQVSLGSHNLGRLNMHASSTHYRQTLWLPATSTLSGTLVATTLSKAPVYLDGVAVWH